MKKLMKKLSKLIVGVSATALLATAGASTVQAIDTDVVDEAWANQPSYTAVALVMLNFKILKSYLKLIVWKMLRTRLL